MSNSIIFITKTFHHTVIAEEANTESNLNIPIYFNEDAEKCIEIGKEQVAKGTHVIISTDYLCDRFMEELNIPIIRIRRDSFSFITKIVETKSIYGKVALIVRDSNSAFNAAGMDAKALLPEAVSLYLYHEKDDISEIVKKIKCDGHQIILGPSWIKEEAIKMDLKYDYVPLLKRDYLDAIRTAQFYVNVYRTKTQNIELINTLLNKISEGVITFDSNGTIIHNNKSASKILKLDYAIIGRNIVDTPLNKLKFHDFDKKKENQIFELDGEIILYNSFPIVIDNKVSMVIITMNTADDIQSTERKIRNKLLSKGNYAVKTFSSIIGCSNQITECAAIAKRFASVDSTVLITGPSGTGKEVFAQSIHNESKRKSKPFVVINCGALPESILESILFGYEPGTFTGARSGGKIGLFELAHGGTVFLDEVSEMSLVMQSRFLRVLQEHEIMRIGSDSAIPIDIRVIAATNKDLHTLVTNGEFREDFFYRLNVLRLRIPALNDRRDDIEPLTKYFINVKSKELNIRINEITNEALSLLKQIDYAGNVRQLNNIIERAMVISSSGVIDSFTIKQSIGLVGNNLLTNNSISPETISLKEHTDDFVKTSLIKTLENNEGSRQKTAEQLGISTTTLWRKMKSLGIL